MKRSHKRELLQKYNNEVYAYNNEIHRRKILIVMSLYLENENFINNRPRRWYIRPLLRERAVHGHFNTMLKNYQLTSSALYFNFARMTPTSFEELVQLIGPRIMRIPLRHDVLSVGEVLGATLRYLATGKSMTNIMYSFRIGKSTISKIVLDCCNVLWDELKDKVLFSPSENGWKNIAHDFETMWQMPHCVGALDGKHVVHQAYPKTGSTNYNYKGSHSTILMALCDANCNFSYVNIGMPGRYSDGGVFKSCELGKRLSRDDLFFPKESPISSSSGNIPYFIIGDEAFPLMKTLMRPYPGRGKQKLPLDVAIFNYRLSRARRCIENAFGILSSRWRIYRQVIVASEQTVNAIIKATVVLHNFIKNKEMESGILSYSQSLDTEGNTIHQNSGLMPVQRMGSNFYDTEAKEIRNKLKDYFNSEEGAVPFQYNYI